MVEPTTYRYRVTYSKGPSLRFIGHLDLLRTWERTLRRAKVPMAYTKGFHPHQRINMGVALPLGFSSECEILDLWMEEEVEASDLLSQIIEAIPPGIELHSIEKVASASPTLQKRIQLAEYEVGLGSDMSSGDVTAVVVDLLRQETIVRERRGKAYDLRPLIDSIEVGGVDRDITLRMRLAASQEGTGRPDEVLRALGIKPESAQIARTRLILSEE